MRRWRILVGLATAACLLPAAAAPAADLERRQFYAKRADLFVDGVGMARLALPAEILAECQQDAADLLILDPRGAEIPYALDSGVDLDEVREVVETVPAEVLDSVRGESTGPSGDAFFLERFEIARPPVTAPGTTQHLLVEAGRRGSLQVEAASASDQGHRVWSPPIIDLAHWESGEWGREIELPADLGTRLSVVLRGRDPRAAPPVMLFRAVRVQVQERVRVELEPLGLRSEAGFTRIELARPAGWRLDALEIETSTVAFSRRVAVVDVATRGGGVEVGAATLTRVGDAASPVAEIIPLVPVRGDHLRVDIRDADSPPLADLRLYAVVRRPALVFPVRQVVDGRAGTLLFGGGRVRRPRYDLQDILTGGDAQARSDLYDSAASLPARLGPVEANPDFEARPVLHFAMQAGAGIDTAEYLHWRRLDVPASPDGLSRLLLPAQDIARARPDLADLRVVDARKRQWPYVLQRGEAEEWLAVTGVRGAEADGQSRFVFELPVAPLPVDHLSLQMRTLYFQRPFELLGFDEANQARTLVRGSLRSDVDESAAVDIAFAEMRAVRLELVVEDGDDAPLRIGRARVRYPVPAVFLVAPPGTYTLLLGNPAAERPRYDLANIHGVLFSVSSTDAVTGESSENPDYVPPERRERAARWERSGRVLLVWGSLVGAVVVLAVLTLRQVRAEPGGEP